MKIACILTPFNDRNLQLAAQIGVEEIVCLYPGLKLQDLLDTRDRVADHGMRLTTIERLIPHLKIVHNLPGAQQQTDDFKTLIQNAAEAGLTTLCYNWMPSDDWHRTDFAAKERGGALVTAFNLDKAESSSVPRDTGYAQSEKKTSASELWDNLQRFLEQVVPVAEACGINLALHPDDPPLPKFRGNDQIIISVENMEKAAQLVPSPRNGLCLCQGSLASVGDIDIPAAIRRLGPRIKFVHFRDVVGALPDFRETFHDNGKTDMAACWRAYEEVGLDNVPIRPDHVPTLAGETNENPGYEMLGRLYAVGYMKGLRDAIANG